MPNKIDIPVEDAKHVMKVSPILNEYINKLVKEAWDVLELKLKHEHSNAIGGDKNRKGIISKI